MVSGSIPGHSSLDVKVSLGKLLNPKLLLMTLLMCESIFNEQVCTYKSHLLHECVYEWVNAIV